DADHRRASELELAAHEDGARALLDGGGRVIVSVEALAHERDEELAAAHRAAIRHDAHDVDVLTDEVSAGEGRDLAQPETGAVLGDRRGHQPFTLLSTCALATSRSSKGILVSPRIW